MDDTQLNRLLTPHDRWTDSPELLDAMLERVARNAAEQHARPPRRRRGVRIAATLGALLGVGALATAAAVYIAPNFTPDAVIPISYVTDEGNTVECTYSLAVTSWDGTNVTEAKDWIASHDWLTIGARESAMTIFFTSPMRISHTPDRAWSPSGGVRSDWNWGSWICARPIGPATSWGK